MTQVAFDFEKTMAPGKAIAELALKNMEKFVGFNIEMYSKYSALTLENTKEALAVTDMKAAQAYLGKQSEKASSTLETIMNDANTAVEMGKAYTEELTVLLNDFGEKAVEAAKAAAPAAKKPAAKKAA